MKNATLTRLIQGAAIAGGSGLLLALSSWFIVEFLWFQEVDYLATFWVQVVVRSVLALTVTGLSGLYLLGHLALGEHLRPSLDTQSPHSFPTVPSQGGLNLWQFLLIVTGSGVLLGLVLWHYGQGAIALWQSQQGLSHLTAPTGILAPLRLKNLGYLLLKARTIPWVWAIGGGLVLGLLFLSRFLIRAIALGFSVGLGWIASGQWMGVVQFFHPVNFGQTDPQFHREISFYIFSLPILELLECWWVGVTLVGLIAVGLWYVLGDNNFSQGWCPGFTSDQWRHLHGLAGALMGAIALSYWNKRFELLYSTQGVIYGAGYTDIHVLLVTYGILCGLAIGMATFLVGTALFWSKGAWVRSGDRLKWGGSIFATVLLIGVVLTFTVQQIWVQPNELAREASFIVRNLQSTQIAFDLKDIDVQTFDPKNDLTLGDLARNQATIGNIRLWDTRPLLETNRQLQQIRPYYRFFDADIDRYNLLNEEGKQEKQQVLIAARELDATAIPTEAQTWINRHLVYTHGYGFTMSPVNQVGAGGLPTYLVKDFEQTTAGQDLSLSTLNEGIRASIPIEEPRIYYGELTNTYSLVRTQVQEIDRPSGDANVYTTYDGRGGIHLGQGWKRGLFALYLRDWRLLFAQSFTPETQVLIRRNIMKRVQAIAPFLRYDSDPYLVVERANFQNPQKPDSSQTDTPTNTLYWVIDAYTTSTRYPYADPGKNPFNYVRNSVKIIVDAYHGSVYFYVANKEDPIIQSWARIFPKLFRPLETMPTTLRKHIRYPQDLFRVQSEQLMAYHMTDPQVFYNREDQWRSPSEIYGDERKLIEPYYLIMKLPTGKVDEEFILLQPYTPANRNNLIAWLSARSDGIQYGNRLLYRFPKQELVYGPEQVEARINQDPVISQQISLWSRQGSRAVQGNLLVIPIEQSLLYVEPVYLEATENSLPTLVRVIVIYKDRIVMAPTLQEALDTVFETDFKGDAQKILTSPSRLKNSEGPDPLSLPEEILLQPIE